MRLVLRVSLVGILCATAAGAAVLGMSSAKDRALIWSLVRLETPRAPAPGGKTGRDLSKVAMPLFGSGGFDLAGYPAACRYTAPIRDRSSLDELRAAIKARSQRGFAALQAELRAIPKDAPDANLRAFVARTSLADLSMYEGKFRAAASWIEQALADSSGLPDDLRANYTAMLGVVHLRRGETENCLECIGPSSCIFPIVPEAVHQRPSGSREAVRHFRAYLEKRPQDFGVRYLLNVAYMTLGEYPASVPPEYLVPLEPFRSKLDVGQFENVAALVGLDARGPNMAGGAVFDDFNGDDLPDLLVTSLDVDLGAGLFVNNGKGAFEDHTAGSGLASQPLALNAKQADYDNDGDLDVLLIRGGWETPYRLSLLRNQGHGAFEDVTVSAGLAEPIACQSAAWGDFDNDGRLDLFVCGEYATGARDGLFTTGGNLSLSDPRNRCRLYRNRGDGTFVDVADRAGVCNDRFAKGAVWGDYDRDGWLDLYVSNYGGGNRLYRNQGDGTFVDVASVLGVHCPYFNFSCWFWDYDNDGRLDLYVSLYGGGLNDVVASALGRPTNAQLHPRLFRNLGPEGFRDVSSEAGLNRTLLPMGSNFGDIDNDGFLDFYLATGQPGYSALMPNVLYKNVAGERFEDITMSSRTGHLQKGHAVSFADYDGDGDLDLFVETGGATPGDRAYNVLFRNPGHNHHWVKLKLVGTRTNRSAIGAMVEAVVRGANGQTRSIHRQIGGSSSYGASSLVELIGLGDATSVAELIVTWPVSRSRQVFRDLAADTGFEITEGADAVRVLDAPVPVSPAQQPRSLPSGRPVNSAPGR